MYRISFRTICTAAAATALLAGGVGTATARAVRAAPDLTRPRWHQVTTAGLENFTDIGLARGADGVLHVLWTSGDTAGHYDVSDTPIQPDGTPDPPVSLEKRLWEASFPDATVTPGGLDAFWNNVDNSTPNSIMGTAKATHPSRGGSWAYFKFVTPTVSKVDNWGFGVSAGTGADGQPWVVFTDGGSGLELLHYGHVKRQFNIGNMCCIYDPGIGVDSKTSAAWLTYYSLIPHHVGVYAQDLAENGAKVGKAVLLPGSDAGGGATPINTRVTATGLGDGRPGVYTTYLHGYPDAKSVDLIQLGPSTFPEAVGKGNGQTRGSTLAADPDGRIWVAWWGPKIYFRRAAAGPSNFGPVGSVSLPVGTQSLWKAYINADTNSLEILALLTVDGRTAYWATRVAPPK
jgi:hypothetical protein